MIDKLFFTRFRKRLSRRNGRPSFRLPFTERLETRTLLAANLAPVNAVPEAQMATVDQPFAFTSYRGNQISISDPDAGSANVQVTLSVDRGTLDLINRNPGNRLTYSAGDGFEDASMTFTGTIADINTALSWISYRPQSERFFQWKSSAGGNDHWYEYVSTGATWTAANTAAAASGGYLATLTSSGENAFVNALLPTNAEPWLGGYQDRSGFTFSEPLGGWKWANGEAWSYANWGSGQPDDAGGTEHYLTTNASGSLKWNDRPNTFSTSYVLEYDFDPRPAGQPAATLTITTNDLGNVGTGGAKSDTDTVSITVNPVASFAPSPSVPTLPAALDTSFNATGRQVLSVTAGIDIIYDMKTMPDGKIVAVGAVNDRFGIMRFNADMTLDATFGSGGGTQTDFGAGVHARSFVIDSQGRFILVGGNRVARYTANGILDTTFGTGGSVANDHLGQGYAIAIQPDGRIVTAGRDNDSLRIVRLIDTGAVDALWAYDPQSDGRDYGRGIVIRDDGDILITGRANGYWDSNSRFVVVRVNSVGVQEEEFRYDFGANEFVNTSLTLPDGKILLVGTTEGDLAISRHTFSGALDTSFGTSGSVKIPILNATDEGYRATLTADGKILVTGFANNGVDQDIVVVRLSYDGVPDSSFGIGGKVSFNLGSNDYGYVITQLANGKILVAGRSGNDIALVRLLGDSDQQKPTATFAAVATPTKASLSSISVTFDEAVTGITTGSFTLTRNGSPISLATATLTGSGTSRMLGNLAGLTSSPGTYLLTLNATGVTDLAGNALAAQATQTWTVEPGPVLSGTSILEHQPVGTAVATLTSNDPDGLQIFTYSLVSGTGSVDNTAFAVVGNQLRTAAVFDFEIRAAYQIRLRATDQFGGFSENTFAISVVDTAELRVTSLTPTASGFRATFNRAIVAADLNLYDQSGTLGAPDVTIVGASTGPVRGSVVVDATGTGFTFVRTGSVLPSDTYAVTLRSASNAFHDAAGQLLDGDGNGTPGDDYSSTFVISQPANAVVVGISDFARGAGQTVNVPATGSGLPLMLSSGRNVTGLDFTLVYDATLLTVSDFVLEQSLVDAGVQVAVNAATAGLARLSIFGTAALAAVDGALTVGRFLASVPQSAAYPAKQVLDIQNLVVHDAAPGVPGVRQSLDDDAIQVSGYLGDLNANRLIQANDAILSARITAGVNTGLSGYQTADPTIVADISGDGLIQGNDAVGVARVAAGFIVPSIPSVPIGLPTPPTGTDPLLKVGSVSNLAGATIVVPVTVEIPSGQPAMAFSGFDLAISYDPSKLTFSSIAASTFTSGFSITPNTTLGGGTLAVSAFTSGQTETIDATSGTRVLANVTFTINQSALSGVTVVNLLANNAGQQFTALFDSGANEAVLGSPPTNAATDLVDGIVTIQENNQSPTDIALLVSSIAENRPSGTTVGTLSTTDPDAGNIFTYTLVSGIGSNDNASFTVSGNVLQTAASFDYETQSSYSIRIRATDQGGLFTEKWFTITVTDVNDAPTDVALSASSIAENQPAGTTVGTLSTTDPDVGNSFTYALVSGAGSTDNASFFISGNLLRTAAGFDFEAKNFYSIRVRSTDQGGLFTEKTFTISVTNINEAPTDVSLSNSSITEKRPVGTTVGTLSTSDPDTGNTFTYTFVSGAGSADNASFTISGNVLRAAASFNYDTRSSYSIRVRSTDQNGLSTDKVFEITVISLTTDRSISVAAGVVAVDNDVHSGFTRLVKRGPGSLVLALANSHSSGTVVEEGELIVRFVGSLGTGTVVVKPGAKLSLDFGPQSIALAGLQIHPGGLIDVGMGRFVLSAGTFNLGAIRDQIRAGRAEATWAGTGGITSVTAARTNGRAIGHSLDSSGSLIVGFAGNGDLNLDGVVDFDDVVALVSAGCFDTGRPATWDTGDVNYDDVVDFDDIVEIVSAGLFDQGSYLFGQTQAITLQSFQAEAPVGFDPIDAAFASLATDQQTTSNMLVKKKSTAWIL